MDNAKNMEVNPMTQFTNLENGENSVGPSPDATQTPMHRNQAAINVFDEDGINLTTNALAHGLEDANMQFTSQDNHNLDMPF